MLNTPQHIKISESGWINPARHVCSPNFGARPAGAEVSLLVVHNISLPPGEFGNGYIEQFFTNQLDPDLHPYFATIAAVQVSSHVLITRAGELVQFVSLFDRAWHAGRSCFAGVAECNDYSIGVELEGTDTDAYTEAQYAALGRLTDALLAYFPKMTPERITGHCDIAPGRKTDPGEAFDWAKYYSHITLR